MSESWWAEVKQDVNRDDKADKRSVRVSMIVSRECMKSSPGWGSCVHPV